MRIVVAIVVAVVSVWSHPALAQGVAPFSPPQPVERAPAGTGTVRGRVVSDGGQALGNATLRLIVAPGSPPVGPFTPFTATASSDADGRFEFAGVPVGTFTVSAEKSGYYNTYEGEDAAARGASLQRMRPLAAGQTIDDVVVSLSRAGVITGKVLLPSGEPAERMYVEVLRRSRGPAGMRWAAGGRGGPATTDDTGAFRVFGLPPAEYVVSVRPTMGQGFSGMGERDASRDGVAVTYFPGTTRLADAKTVTVKSGEETSGLVLSLAPAKLAMIRGRVIAPAGIDITTVSVSIGEIVPERMGSGMSGRSVNADGTFSATRLTPGRYRLTAGDSRSARPGQGLRLFASTIVDVDGVDLDDVVLVLAPGATLAGRVVTTVGEPVPNASSLRVNHVRSDMDSMMMPPPPPVDVQADGTFRIEHVFTPGLLRLLPSGAATAGPGARPMLAAVKVNGRDVSDVPLDPVDVRDLTLVVTSSPPELKGRVTGGAAANGTRPLVVVFPEDEARWTPQSIGVRSAAVRPDGSFTLRGLPPGDRYLAVAVDGLESIEVWTDGMLAALRPAATPVRLEDGGVHEIALTAVPRPRP